MTRPQVLQVCRARYAARLLNRRDFCAKQSLAAPREYDSLLDGFTDSWRFPYLLNLMFFPFGLARECNSLAGLGDSPVLHHCSRLRANEVDELASDRGAQPGEIDGLKPVTICLQR